MNLGEQRARVRRLTGIRMTDIVSDVAIDELVNEAYREVCALELWPFLFVETQATAEPGVETLDLPVPVRLLSSVTVGGRPVRQVALHDLDGLEAAPGEPQVYATVDADRVRLWPAPETATVVQVRGYRQPSTLSQDADAPLFDREFHPALSYAAAARLLTEEGDDSIRPQSYGAEAGQLVAGMRQRYLAVTDTRSFQMGGRRSSRRRWRL